MRATAIQRQVPISDQRDTQVVTLLELVNAVCEVTEDEHEVVCTVLSLLRSGRVRLGGNFRGADVSEFS